MTRTQRLWTVFAFNLALVGALVGVGVTSHSIGVWAEGVDYLGDASAIGVALLALHMEGPTPRRPHGHPKASAYSALFNASSLLILTLVVAAGSLDRLATGTQRVHGFPVLVVSGVAAVVMLAGAVILLGDVDDGNSGAGLSVRAVLLDTASDAAAAVGVATAGGIIYATSTLYWLDPAVALAICVPVTAKALRLLTDIRAAIATAQEHES